MPPTAEQTALLECLAKRSTKLARIYGSCLRLLHDEEDDGRFPLVAHSMRELIDHCPILTGSPRASRGDSVKSRVAPVRESYLRISTQVVDDATPIAAVESEVRTLLQALGRFFQWMEENRPQKFVGTAKLLSALSGPGQPLPVDVSNNEVTRWIAAYDYFNKIAHNGEDEVTQSEFVGHMMFIERVLFQRLQPRAIADLDTLDALIKEGEDGH